MSPKVTQIYLDHIEPLARAERQELLSLLERELRGEPHAGRAGEKHSILELEGLGSEVWGGIDAQEYVDRLRAEWDAPSR
ncbi:MAG: hypothetical protein GHCLOJNM_00063 [bacterium]|nr:hypothetical protein [bacterium]